MRFSQRIGKTPIKINVQKDSMDDDLRIGLWNAFSIYIASRLKKLIYIILLLITSLHFYGLTFLKIL